MVLFATASAAWAVDDGSMTWPALVHGLIGTTLLVSGAVAFNQRFEMRGDAKMKRTANRPLPAGRISRLRVNLYASAATVAGLAYLAVLANRWAVMFGMLSWLLYVAIYTPMKKVTPWQTPVGALAGAMPIMMGAAVADQPFNPLAWILFGIVFFWQMPHAMAIAWRYRKQFDKAGVKLATVLEPTGRAAGVIAVVGAVLLLAVSLIPWGMGLATTAYAVAATLLGVGYLASSAQFLRARTPQTSLRLQRVSLIYLPAILVALLACKVA